jgi:peptidyl-prolyl cis-trans isomerase C
MKRMQIVSSLVFVALLSMNVFAEASDSIVAKFNGGSLKVSDLKKFQSTAPEQIRALPFDKIFKPLRDQKIMEMLLEAEKSKTNIASDPEVIKLKQEAIKSIEMQVFLKKAAEKEITDEKLKPLYEELVKKFKGQKESEVSIIVCNTKADADKAMQELNAGKNFAEVAKKYSQEPNTSAQGGRLGFLLAPAIDQVLGPDIGKAFKILKNNAHSRNIISKGGKFIIVYRGESRAATPPSFEEVKSQLKGMYFQKALLEYLQGLTKKSNLQVYTMDGKPDKFDLLSSKAAKTE